MKRGTKQTPKNSTFKPAGQGKYVQHKDPIRRGMRKYWNCLFAHYQYIKKGFSTDGAVKQVVKHLSLKFVRNFWSKILIWK